MRNLTLFAALLSACLFTPATEAQAYGWGNGFGWGVGGLYRSLDFPTERRVPYFAAHPPVYYSVPVPRTYGYSPFAYSPLTRTPDVVQPAKPVEVVNPHVSSSVRSQAEKLNKQKRTRRTKTISSVETAAPGPLTIENPFFKPSASKDQI